MIVYDKYARYIPRLERREVWEEICYRNSAMHIKKYPKLTSEIVKVYEDYIIPKLALPSMRSLQFAGPPIERNPARIYNCAYMPCEHTDCFSESMFLLLGGTGLGYSVQYHHVEQLPTISSRGNDERRYVVGDSIEGWADAIKVLVESFFRGKEKIRFDYGDIREKGSVLVTSGGKAPGPVPLRICINHIEAILEGAKGRKLTPLEVHDIMCFIADAVLSGGIRRAAMIALFSLDDMDMMTCKSGNWSEINPQRGRANNSVMLLRDHHTKEDFDKVWSRVKASPFGEPGVYWTNDLNWGTNPCCEIALKPYQFCNLTEVNVNDVSSQEDLNNRSRAASFLGTLQAGYTDFHYLRPIWKTTTEEDALLGVGLTGIASGACLKLNLKEAANVVNEENRRVSGILGISPASRTTTVKPSGTSSIVLGCSSGIHAWHSKYFIRRIRLTNDQPLCIYLREKFPSLVEEDFEKPHLGSVICIPQKAPKGSIYRTETSFDLFARAMKFNEEWIKSGYRKGVNHNNVSCTLSVKEKDWDVLGAALWDNKEGYNGMSVFPYKDHKFVQPPLDSCDAATYDELMSHLTQIDLKDVKEFNDGTQHTQEAACAGGACEI